MSRISSFEVSRSTRASKVALVGWIVILGVLISVPFWAGRGDMRFLIEFAYYLTLAQMWNLLAGYAGLVSVGQQAFVGLGGYMLFAASVYFGIHPVIAIPIAGVLIALISIPTAFVVFRLRGAYFAIGTWVVAEVFRLLFAQISSLGGGSGMSIPAKIVKEIASGRTERDMLIYFTALVILVAGTAMVYLLMRSKYGLALTAIRDSEPASDSLGVNIFKTKLTIYVASAAVTGVVGALIFLQKLRISPDVAFSLQDWTAAVIFIVVIGGIGTIEGPIIGTLIYFGLRSLLSDYGSIYMIVLGCVAVVMMLWAPKGVWGLITQKFDLQLFPVNRRVTWK
ncbi:branched-chain amino acid ABC transporter permease [Thalassolituus maritimus]|mgnify:CR=1 FL=1|uniref:branched-chain amino acid ABC transporter permease n=1 Tax=Thalassolituus maritimus TaxID=484498 RepID=UPI000E7F2808|nr:branched-chain amino acid ABC transporter permease [Thalassolituus maritimus]HBW84297.1 branched-chain amino acid ABC transporter permease [Gammaproteobacteria bacterium]|tara:strand:+ start:1252 stop:2265 length:1014 start_codon:yes stop_codon:yes gene_type:complete